MSVRRILKHDPRLLTERDLSSLVVDVARLAGWRRYHTFDSRRSNHGFPDWVFVRNGRLVFAELKSETGKLSDDQAAWLNDLSDVRTVEAWVWRPSDFDDLTEVLTGRRPSAAA